MDRVVSAYEFAVDIAAKGVLSLAMPKKNPQRKSDFVGTLEVWPWSVLIPWFKRDMRQRVRLCPSVSVCSTVALWGLRGITCWLAVGGWGCAKQQPTAQRSRLDSKGRGLSRTGHGACMLARAGRMRVPAQLACAAPLKHVRLVEASLPLGDARPCLLHPEVHVPPWRPLCSGCRLGPPCSCCLRPGAALAVQMEKLRAAALDDPTAWRAYLSPDNKTYYWNEAKNESGGQVVQGGRAVMGRHGGERGAWPAWPAMPT